MGISPGISGRRKDQLSEGNFTQFRQLVRAHFRNETKSPHKDGTIEGRAKPSRGLLAYTYSWPLSSLQNPKMDLVEMEVPDLFAPLLNLAILNKSPLSDFH